MKTLLERGRAGECLADLNIIDLHGHLGMPGFGVPGLDPASLVAAMDRIGVSKIVVSAMQGWLPQMAERNDVTLQAMRRHPGRILGYAALCPIDADTVRAETERRLAEGFIGLKLHSVNGFPYDDPAYAPAFEMANERRMPVLFHVWGEDASLEEVRRVSQRYPETSLLLAHSGCANEDGYIRTARDCPNVYLDVAFSQSFRGLVARLVEAVGAGKVVWGSDAYFFSETQQIGKVLGARVPDDAKRMILAGNAARILERAQTAP